MLAKAASSFGSPAATSGDAAFGYTPLLYRFCKIARRENLMPNRKSNGDAEISHKEFMRFALAA
jgi:hypothetical protein